MGQIRKLEVQKGKALSTIPGLFSALQLGLEFLAFSGPRRGSQAAPWCSSCLELTTKCGVCQVTPPRRHYWALRRPGRQPPKINLLAKQTFSRGDYHFPEYRVTPGTEARKGASETEVVFSFSPCFLPFFQNFLKRCLGIDYCSIFHLLILLTNIN